MHMSIGKEELKLNLEEFNLGAEGYMKVKAHNEYGWKCLIDV